MFWVYFALFMVLGIPLIGYFVINMIRLGKYVYRKYPFLRKFFDNYSDYYGIGFALTIVASIVYIILVLAGVRLI